jgi:hypothetical protein
MVTASKACGRSRRAASAPTGCCSAVGDVTFYDDRHVTGLRGTGSCTVRVDGLEMNQEMYGHLLMGLEPNTPLI